MISSLVNQTYNTTGQAIAPRTLSVAPSWPADADPAAHFTTFTAAMAAAAALSPTISAGVGIEIAPFLFAESIAAITSNTYWRGFGNVGTDINGTLVWTAGAGANAALAATSEHLDWNKVSNFTSGNSITINSTAKSAGTCNFSATKGDFRNIQFTGRTSGANDACFLTDCNLFGTAHLFTDVSVGSGANPGLRMEGCRFRGLNVAGGTVFWLSGCEQNTQAGGSISVAGTANGRIVGTSFILPISVTSTATVGLRLIGCNLTAGAATLAVATGATADIRGSTYAAANLSVAGTGAIDRDNWRGTTSTTSIGAQDITFTIPYPTGTTGYNVLLTLVSGSSTAAPTVTGKAADKFVLTDTDGGNVWDYTIIRT